MLLLDHFEQLVAGARVVAELLRTAPGLKSLATSRVVLHLRGERDYPVSPLGLPDRRRPALERLHRYRGALASASACFEEALAIWQALDVQIGLGFLLISMALLALQQQEYGRDDN